MQITLHQECAELEGDDEETGEDDERHPASIEDGILIFTVRIVRLHSDISIKS